VTGIRVEGQLAAIECDWLAGSAGAGRCRVDGALTFGRGREKVASDGIQSRTIVR
jgi:hypothetical protein